MWYNNNAVSSFSGAADIAACFASWADTLAILFVLFAPVCGHRLLRNPGIHGSFRQRYNSGTFPEYSKMVENQ
jgi:hypothetical protein